MEPIKQAVLDFVRLNGPVLPAHVAKRIEKNILLSGAILSDLLSEKLIKISAAKIGGSPVYYFAGQEAKLEMLYQYLPHKEKEAYNILKEKNVVKDREAVAPIRVAFRSIRDFAIPFQYNNELFWRWYLFPQDRIAEFLPKTEPPKIEIEKEPIKEEKKPVHKKATKNEFLNEVKDYLAKNKMNIINEALNKRNEAGFIIKINSDIGELEFLVNARNKKKISEADLSLAYNKGQKMKLPVIFLSNGVLSKKAEKYLSENLRGYVRFRAMSQIPG